MAWVPGDIIGKGSYSTVRLGRPKKKNPRSPLVIAVKSSASYSDILSREKSILKKLNDSPHIIRCLGHDCTKEDGEKTYNLFLEYADCGSLGDKLKKQNNRKFQESEVRRYTKFILAGVDHIHKNQYIHCDLKPENILLCSSSQSGSENDTLKIADFGLARKYTKRNKRKKSRAGGTPLYFSPEALEGNKQGPPSDIWAIGCIVVKLWTGDSVWRPSPEENVAMLMKRMLLEEIPEIPVDISPEGKDFLQKIFVKDPAKRWTAKELMDHPFVADLKSSPRGPLDWTSGYKSSKSTYSTTEEPSIKASNLISFMTKLRRLLTCQGQD